VLLALLAACAPSVYRMPGPLSGLGSEPAPEWHRRPERARPPAPPPVVRPPKPGPSPEEIAAAAAAYVGASRIEVGGTRYRFDCSGLVEASLASAGCPFTGSSASLFEQARDLRVLHRRRRPSPGDVAFFDNTYDRDGNGRRDDPLSHVAVVESVASDGTITMVHVGSKGVTRLVMNLRHPEDRTNEAGAVINDYLRAPTKGDSPRTRRLAGELWVGFASFWQVDQPAVSERSTR
jgi:hypothetical protein